MCETSGRFSKNYLFCEKYTNSEKTFRFLHGAVTKEKAEHFLFPSNITNSWKNPVGILYKP